MPLLPPGGRPPGPDPDERALGEFEELWISGEPSLERFWLGLGPRRPLSLLSSLVKVDLQARFERGERPRAAEYIDRFPELAGDGERVLSIVYEEFCLLGEVGVAVDSEEFCDGYSRWRDSLRSQLAYHRELSQVAGVEPPRPKYPSPGDRFANYRLRSILGTGGAATVYLASEDDLGDRRVALKISGSFGREPSILANLDHRNIVPILSITSSEGTELRGFSMPYRPGVTLEEVIRRVGRGQVPRSARAFWDSLAPAAIEGEDQPRGKRVGWAGFPIRGTYSDAVAWIALALTNALSYLHQRKVLHRDIKPANILLAHEDGPQLLDFNLAHDRNAAEHAHAALKGGTLPYMAPEQLQAFVEPSRWSSVESAADLYSLGLVLRELLSGQPPELPNRQLSLPRTINALLDRRASGEVSVRQANPNVPHSLAAIVAKCLAFDPQRRYETAEDLGTDLQRFLDRRKLKFAPNVSIFERLRNLIFRNRSAILGATAAILLLTLSRVGDLHQNRVESDRNLPEAVRDYRSGDPDRHLRARVTFERLHEAYPGSALPLLYLGQIWMAKKVDLGQQYLERAIRCDDVGPALDSMLAHDPRSITLLMAKGWLLYNHRRYEESRAAMVDVIEIYPDHHGALELLGRCESMLDRLPEAIDHFKQAIRIVERDPSKQPLLSKLRKLHWMFLAWRLDSRLDREPGLIGAAKDLDALRANLETLRVDLSRPTNATEHDQNEMTLAFYEGVLRSREGAIAARGGRDPEARADFGRARDAFAVVLKIMTSRFGRTEGFRKELGQELDLLDRREAQVKPAD